MVEFINHAKISTANAHSAIRLMLQPRKRLELATTSAGAKISHFRGVRDAARKLSLKFPSNIELGKELLTIQVECQIDISKLKKGGQRPQKKLFRNGKKQAK